MFAVRGAVRVERNDRDVILGGARRLLREIVARNGLSTERVVAAHFTMTPDLDAAFPAYAARELGWSEVPMLGAQETPVPGAPDRMLRVMLLVDGEGEARHVYLGEAARLRPDLAEAAPRGEADLGVLLVVGLGLIGGSAALALRRSGRFAAVLGIDVEEEAVETARSIEAVDRARSDPGSLSLIAEADVVLLSVPVDRIPEWIERHGGTLEPRTVLLDTGSTKRDVVAAMDGLPDGVEAVGGHPLAGSERGGAENARADLFRGATWALAATGRTGPRSRSVAEAVVDAVGARAVWVDAAAHDRAVAATSHLPYLASAALAAHVAESDGTDAERLLRGPGLRDTTRLAGTPARMMAGVLATNWPEAREELSAYEGRLRELRERLERAAAGSGRTDPERVARFERTLKEEAGAGSSDRPR